MKKSLLFTVLVVAIVAVVLAGCATTTLQGDDGGVVSVSARGSRRSIYETWITVTASGREVEVQAENVRWYYDVPADKPEYVELLGSSGSTSATLMIHKHE